MNDSADIKQASQRLQVALSNLVKTINPLVDRIDRLEAAVNEGRQFNEDRARLARELDESQANLAVVSAREASISNLAKETRTELDQAIKDIEAIVQSVDGEGG
ncbi:MAG: hypothetical protein ABJ275_08830 [Maricaulaceae bacterium]